MDLIEMFMNIRKLAELVGKYDISRIIENETRLSQMQAAIEKINSGRDSKIGSMEELLSLIQSWLTGLNSESEIDQAILDAKFKEGFESGKASVDISASLDAKYSEGLAAGLKDLEAKIEQAKLEAMTLNDDEVAALAEKVGFDKGVASVVIPEMPDVAALEKAAFDSGVASVDVAGQINSALETLKSEGAAKEFELNSKIDSLNLNLSLMLNEKEALIGQVASKDELLAQIQGNLDLMAQDNSKLSGEKAEALAKVDELTVKVSELEAKIAELTKVPETPVVTEPEIPVVTEPEAPVVTEPEVTPAPEVQVPIEETTPVEETKPVDEAAPVDSAPSEGGEETVKPDETQSV